MRNYGVLRGSIRTPHSVVAICFIILMSTAGSYGHGRLMEPPSRSSLFRFGYPVPVNYHDNQLFCGGYAVQWEHNGGRCGVCGDSWDGPRENEAGGKYANGIIVRRYEPGAAIMVQVELTAPHKGWFEFRLCANNNPRHPVTHRCLDKHLLELEDGTGSRYAVGGSRGLISIGLWLPAGLTCSQCVLQWKYNAGNSWGVDEYGLGCVGCGPQEQFYGCADVAIGPGSGESFDTGMYIDWSDSDENTGNNRDHYDTGNNRDHYDTSNDRDHYDTGNNRDHYAWPRLLPPHPTTTGVTAGSSSLRAGFTACLTWRVITTTWALINLVKRVTPY